MDNYFTYMTLLGLHESNLPPFRDARIKRYKSVQKMVELVSLAGKLAPSFPVRLFHLDSANPEWDDVMPFPVIDYRRHVSYGIMMGVNMLFYAYNYNVLTSNIRFRTLRYAFPLLNAGLFGAGYVRYKTQIHKINIFDEYCWLRAQELVKQNEYLFKHEDVKRFLWFFEDYMETLGRVHRQANNHHASDFKDSELILQDFINRYADPSAVRPLKDFKLIQA